jgi:hypothetical protein
MRRAQLAPSEAGDVVHARLGRPAQDALEAAVVLEAWGGVPTVAALGMSAGVLLRDTPPDPDPRAGRWTPAEPGSRDGIIAEGVALLMAILAIAAWAGPLSRQLGPAVLERALGVALPVTLSLQWLIRSRYLSRRAGLRCLAEDRIPLSLAAVAIGALLLSLPGFGPIAAMLVAIWVGGTVLARRGWGVAYGALLIAEAAGLEAGLVAGVSLGAVTLVTLVAVAVAIQTAGAPSSEPPGRVARALAASVLGALLGGLLVGDTSLGWGVHGAFPALALVPSVIGSFWGGYHLWQLHDELPRGLRGVPLADASGRLSGGPAAAIVTGALLRLVGATTALSVMVLAVGQWTRGYDDPSLFVAFGCAALVCLLVSLLESLSLLRWALLSAAAGVAAELAVNRWSGVSIPGAGLIAGGVLGTSLAVVPLAGLLRCPGRMLATTLWIR